VSIFKLVKNSKFICLINLPALVTVVSCNPSSQPTIREIDVQAGDVTLHVRIAGDQGAEEMLIAVHGGPGNSSDYMLSLESLQSDALSVVTYDQRGTGRSSRPSEGYALLKYVQDLEAVRQVVGSEEVHLLGHSWGGVVAMRYATVYPHRVKSIVLAGSGPPNADAAMAAQASLVRRINMLQQMGEIAVELPSEGKELVSAILPAYFSDSGFRMPDELANMSFNQEVSTQTYAAIGAWDFREGIGLLEHRVLLLWGEDDPFGSIMPEATMTALASADVEFVILEACGHYWHECPQPFFSQVRSFLGLESTP